MLPGNHFLFSFSGFGYDWSRQRTFINNLKIEFYVRQLSRMTIAMCCYQCCCSNRSMDSGSCSHQIQLNCEHQKKKKKLLNLGRRSKQMTFFFCWIRNEIYKRMDISMNCVFLFINKRRSTHRSIDANYKWKWTKKTCEYFSCFFIMQCIHLRHHWGDEIKKSFDWKILMWMRAHTVATTTNTAKDKKSRKNK